MIATNDGATDLFSASFKRLVPDAMSFYQFWELKFSCPQSESPTIRCLTETSTHAAAAVERSRTHVLWLTQWYDDGFRFFIGTTIFNLAISMKLTSSWCGR